MNKERFGHLSLEAWDIVLIESKVFTLKRNNIMLQPFISDAGDFSYLSPGLRLPLAKKAWWGNTPAAEQEVRFEDPRSQLPLSLGDDRFWYQIIYSKNILADNREGAGEVKAVSHSSLPKPG